jgi:hypothetical protein
MRSSLSSPNSVGIVPPISRLVNAEEVQIRKESDFRRYRSFQGCNTIVYERRTPEFELLQVSQQTNGCGDAANVPQSTNVETSKVAHDALGKLSAGKDVPCNLGKS